MLLRRYRRNPEITVALKRPDLPLTTLTIDSNKYSPKLIELIGAQYEFHTFAVANGGAIIMAIDEFGYYKKDLPFNFMWRESRIIGTAIFIKEGADGELTSLSSEDLRNLKRVTGSLGDNPRLFGQSKSCSHCKGRGLVYSGLCPMCHGAGMIAPRRNPRLYGHSKPCEHCKGQGLVYSGVCSMCGGMGRIAPRRNPLTENRIVGLLCMAVWARGDAGEAQQARQMIIKQLNAASASELPLIKTSYKKAVEGSTSQEGALEKLRGIWQEVTSFPAVSFAELTGIASTPPPKAPKTPKPKVTKTTTKAPRTSGRRTRRPRTEASGCILCGADSRGKPLCRKHYYESIGKAFVETCQHPGCEEPSRGQPLCRKHYYGQ